MFKSSIKENVFKAALTASLVLFSIILLNLDEIIRATNSRWITSCSLSPSPCRLLSLPSSKAPAPLQPLSPSQGSPDWTPATQVWCLNYQPEVSVEVSIGAKLVELQRSTCLWYHSVLIYFVSQHNISFLCFILCLFLNYSLVIGYLYLCCVILLPCSKHACYYWRVSSFDWG